MTSVPTNLRPQNTSQPQQQSQGVSRLKDELRSDIKFERLEIAAYRRFGPILRSVDELESKVNALWNDAAIATLK